MLNTSGKSARDEELDEDLGADTPDSTGDEGVDEGAPSASGDIRDNVDSETSEEPVAQETPKEVAPVDQLAVNFAAIKFIAQCVLDPSRFQDFKALFPSLF